MPSNISIRTIALRMRKAVDQYEVDNRMAHDLLACAGTLEANMPTLSQLESVRIVLVDAIDNGGLPLQRCLTSLDHWIERERKTSNGQKLRGRKPGWMEANEAIAERARAMRKRDVTTMALERDGVFNEPIAIPELPDWMNKPIFLDEVDATPALAEPVPTAVLAMTGAIRVLLDEIDTGDYTFDTFDDLAVFVRALRRLG